MKRARSAGFTLAEMLVALFITGLVSAAGASLLVSASQSGKQMGEFSERLQNLEVAQALIRSDAAAMVPLTFDPNDDFGVVGGLAWRPFQSDGPVMYFYRNGWLHSEETPTQSDLQAVAYEIENGALVRTAHLPSERKENYPKRTLFEGVDRVELRVFRNSRWVDEPQFDLFGEVHWPELIEFMVHFSDEKSLRIVAISGARQ